MKSLRKKLSSMNHLLTTAIWLVAIDLPALLVLMSEQTQ